MPLNALFNTRVQMAINRHVLAQATHIARNPRYKQVLRKTMIDDARAKLEVHVHDGPQGVGYTIYVETVENGVKWVKAHGVGAHSQSHDWIALSAQV